MKFSPLVDAAMVKSLDERCPSCGLNWWLAPPVKVHHSKRVRCIECKDVFDRTTLALVPQQQNTTQEKT